jgi:hypothetical protein
MRGDRLQARHMCNERPKAINRQLMKLESTRAANNEGPINQCVSGSCYVLAISVSWEPQSLQRAKWSRQFQNCARDALILYGCALNSEQLKRHKPKGHSAMDFITPKDGWNARPEPLRPLIYASYAAPKKQKQRAGIKAIRPRNAEIRRLYRYPS